MNNNVAIKGERDSSLELLRILCMFFVINMHFLGHGKPLDPVVLDIMKNDFLGNTIPSWIVYATDIAVNCFVLISGFFGIRWRLKGFLNLYLACVFFSALGYLIANVGENFNLFGFILTSLLCFSNGGNGWWFITAYVILYCFSPIINRGIDSLDKRQFLIVLILLTFVNVWMGYARCVQMANSEGGFNASQLIYIYVIGRYIGKFVKKDGLIRIRKSALVIFIISAISYVGLGHLDANMQHIPLWHHSYTNPVLIVESVAFFCFVGSFTFKSKWINYLAGSALAAYLLQEQGCISHPIIYPMVSKLQESIILKYGCFVDRMAIFGLSILFMIIAIIIDKFRIYLQNIFFWPIYDRVIKKDYAI